MVVVPLGKQLVGAEDRIMEVLVASVETTGDMMTRMGTRRVVIMMIMRVSETGRRTTRTSMTRRMKWRRMYTKMTVQTTKVTGLEQHRHLLRRHLFRHLLPKRLDGAVVFSVPVMALIRQRGAAGKLLAWQRIIVACPECALAPNLQLDIDSHDLRMTAGSRELASTVLLLWGMERRWILLLKHLVGYLS